MAARTNTLEKQADRGRMAARKRRRDDRRRHRLLGRDPAHRQAQRRRAGSCNSAPELRGLTSYGAPADLLVGGLPGIEDVDDWPRLARRVHKGIHPLSDAERDAIMSSSRGLPL